MSQLDPIPERDRFARRALVWAVAALAIGVGILRETPDEYTGTDVWAYALIGFALWMFYFGWSTASY